MSKHKIIAILGPTASGKSDLSLKLGENYKLPILNCDSKLFYNGFDKVINYEKNWIFYPMSKWGY